MTGLTRYLSWEMLFIHGLTGLLFGVVNVVLFAALLPDRWPIALAMSPFALFCAWGWYAEAKFVERASRDMRRGS